MFTYRFMKAIIVYQGSCTLNTPYQYILYLEFSLQRLNFPLPFLFLYYHFSSLVHFLSFITSVAKKIV